MIDFGLFQTADPKMHRILVTAQAVALTTAPVLISGEQGVGKKLLIKMILEKSRTRKTIHRWGPFSPIFSKTGSSETELKKGDVVVIQELDQMSLMQQSEIGDLIDQAKEQDLQIRWFATCGQAPTELVQRNELRKDLFYRLSVIHLEIPSLRERDGDIEILAPFFVQVFSLMKNRHPQTISAEAKMKLLSYSWPGNVAEFENVIERAVSLTDGTEIGPESIQFTEMTRRHLQVEGVTLSDMERKLILQTLQITQQNKTKAAQILGISIRTLRNKLNEYRELGETLSQGGAR